MPGTGDGAQRLRELDDDGVDAEILLPPFFGVRRLPQLPAEASIAVARGYNDWLSQEYTAGDPARYTTRFSCTASVDGGRTFLPTFRAATVRSDEATRSANSNQ